MTLPDDQVLDDVDALVAADPGMMLRATGDAGAQVRRALAGIDRDAVRRIAADGRPRSVVVVGMGGSGISGDVLAAVCGSGCPVLVTTIRDYTLPGWVGPLDLVLAVSCSGSTEETLNVAAEAVKRGCRVVGVGSAGSPLEQTVRSTTSGVFLAVDAGDLMPRASLWLLATPLLVVANALEIADVPDSALERAADVLDSVATECGVAVPLADNPAKILGLSLAGSLPMVWGTSFVGDLAAYRMACQFNENAKLPVVFGAIPEANHNQVVSLDGPFAGSAGDDIFRDPFEDGSGPARLRLVLLRDTDEHPQDARRADVTRDIAERRGVAVHVVTARSGHVVERLASLTAIADWSSVYAAIALGIDPSPIGPINELKGRIA
ncbi:SIS domain-containing protein [Longivirga aurantiaca]|uniref:SIS domain-containing protein n=1 Tax=Longivirga aurantiaca TaxID=1837743 RepID=A0ABW1SWX1_9ACTN